MNASTFATSSAQRILLTLPNLEFEEMTCNTEIGRLQSFLALYQEYLICNSL